MQGDGILKPESTDSPNGSSRMSSDGNRRNEKSWLSCRSKSLFVSKLSRESRELPQVDELQELRSSSLSLLLLLRSASFKISLSNKIVLDANLTTSIFEIFSSPGRRGRRSFKPIKALLMICNRRLSRSFAARRCLLTPVSIRFRRRGLRLVCFDFFDVGKSSVIWFESSFMSNCGSNALLKSSKSARKSISQFTVSACLQFTIKYNKWWYNLWICDKFKFICKVNEKGALLQVVN